MPKVFLLRIALFFILQSLYAAPLAERFEQMGYVDICDQNHSAVTYETLYASFDECVTFLQTHPVWTQKLYSAKERFIRSQYKHFYSTDFFGLYDESKIQRRNQISFYYSTHLHAFILSHYPEFTKAPVILRFFEACLEIQQPCGHLFETVAGELGLGAIFSSEYNAPPILLKVVKYLPSYTPISPHYDGAAFSLFLHSTDNSSLLLSPYKASFTADDFSTPLREDPEHSILLIPGTLLTEFSIYPTPHVVAASGHFRYSTIAFVMRPHHIPQTIKLSPLPLFKD